MGAPRVITRGGISPTGFRLCEGGILEGTYAGSQGTVMELSVFMRWVSAEAFKDPTTQLVIEWCTAIPGALTEIGFQLIAGHLWRVAPEANPIRFRLYIPDCPSLKLHVLLANHINAMGEHRDRDSTYVEISLRAFCQAWRILKWLHLQTI